MSVPKTTFIDEEQRPNHTYFGFTRSESPRKGVLNALLGYGGTHTHMPQKYRTPHTNHKKRLQSHLPRLFESKGRVAERPFLSLWRPPDCCGKLFDWPHLSVGENSPPSPPLRLPPVASLRQLLYPSAVRAPALREVTAIAAGITRPTENKSASVAYGVGRRSLV